MNESEAQEKSTVETKASKTRPQRSCGWIVRTATPDDNQLQP